MKRFTGILPVLLAAMLQVMPMLRVAFGNPAITSNLAIILRWGIGAAIGLESVDAVSGASPTFQLPTNFTATVGSSFSNSMVVSLANTGNSASTSDGFILTNLLNKADHSAFFSNGQSTTAAIPPGLTCTCISLNNANYIYGSFTGTPTTAGSYVFSATCLSPGNGSVTAKIFFTVSGTAVSPPAITTQPSNATVAAGGNASFSVVAGGGTPLSYQWYFNTNTAIAGATGATLTLNNVQSGNAGKYRVVVSNSGGSATSSDAVLTVLQTSAISTQPANVTAAAGATASFSVTATGTAPLSFQWQKNNSPLNNGGTISGANSNILTIASVTTSDAAGYSVIVTNIAGSATSSVATLTVAIPPAITTQPIGTSVIAGTNVSFSVSATGTAPLVYQWRKNNTPLANGGNVSGATSGTLSITGVSVNDAGIYSVVVTNSVGVTMSSNAILTVFAPPGFVIQAASRTAIAGTSTLFAATVSGTAPLSYQWSKDGLPLSDGVNISGSSSNILVLSNLSTNDIGNYSLTVTNLYGVASSSNAALNVVAAPVPPVISLQPVNQSVVAGTTVSFSVSAAGTDPLSYHWLKNGVAVGINANVFTITNAQSSDNADYSVVITNIAGSVTSLVATLTVFTPPAFVTQAASRLATVGTTTIFSASVSGTAPVTFQWLKNGAPLIDGGNLSGSSSNVLTISTVSTNDAGNYSLFVTNLYGNATSSNAVLTVSTSTGAPRITAQPTAQSVVVSNSVTFSVTASGADPLHYQWRKGTARINGATNSTFSIASTRTSDAGNYSVVITNTAGSIVSSNAALKIFTPPVFVKQAGNRIVKTGTKTVFQAAVRGTAPLGCQWFKDSVALTNGGNIAGAFTTNLVVMVLSTNDAGAYWLAVTNLAGSVISSNTVLNVLVAPAIITQPKSQIVYLNGENTFSATFSVTATGSNPMKYQWKKNGFAITGATAPTYTIANVQSTSAGTYSVVIKNLAGAVQSVGAQLTVSSGNNDNVANTSQNTVSTNTTAITKVPSALIVNSISNGSTILVLTGQPGTNYVIEASADMTSWSRLCSTNAPASGRCQIIDSNTAAYPTRFYRLRTP